MTLHSTWPKAVWVALLMVSTMSAYAQVGATCATPDVISALPYSAAGINTLGSGNDYFTSPCNSTYMGGEDYVFSYTPAADEVVVVTFANASTIWAGLHVMDDCPDNSPSCIGSDIGDGSFTTLTSGEIALTGGVTYYIIASTWPLPDDFVFDIDVQQVACGAPSEATVTAIDAINGTAAIAFTGNGNATATYEVEYGLSGFTLGTGTVLTTTAGVTVASLTGLGNDAYDYYITADCGVDGVSSTAGPFTFSTAAGATCANPVVIDPTSLPFTDLGASTANQGDDYNASNWTSCDDTYTSGPDAVYTITPPSDGVYTFTANFFDFDSSIQLVDGCPDTNPNCVAFVADFNSGIKELTEIPLTGGVTYYLIIDSWGVFSPTVDYDLTVTQVLCATPANLDIANLTATGDVDLVFDGTGNASTTYDIEYGLQGFMPGTGTTVTTAAGVTSYSFTGLTPGAIYDFYVTADCGADGLSNTVGPASFNLAFGATCGSAITVDTDNLPYIETGATTAGFGDDYDSTPCGNPYISGDDVVYEIIPTSDGIFTILTDIPQSNGDFPYGGINLIEGCPDDVNATCVASATNFAFGELAINEIALTGGVTYYLVVSTWAPPQTVTYDLSIFEITCSAPTNIAAATVDTATVSVSWAASVAGSLVDYQVEYGPVGFAPGSGTLLTGVSGTSVDVTGLMPGTEYDFYVYANCGAADGVSLPLGPATAPTECLPIAAPYCEEFVSTESIPVCWEMSGANIWDAGPGNWNTFGSGPIPDDHTPGGGTSFVYADLDWNFATGPAVLTSATYDISTLAEPFVSYWVYSNLSLGAINDGANALEVELYDSVNDMWMLVDSFGQDSSEWVEHFIDITTLPFTVGSTIQLRFSAYPTAPGYIGSNDIALDDVCIKERPTSDVAVTAITAPTSSPTLGSAETVTVQVTNAGFLPATAFFVYYAIDGGPVANTLPDGFVSDNLSSQSSISYTFSTPADLSIEKDYTITAWTEYIDDTDSSNDTFEIVVTHIPVINTLPYAQSFEGETGGWIADAASGTQWELGTPAGTTITAAADGSEAWVTDLDDIYSSNSNATLTSPSFDFSALAADPELTFEFFTVTEQGWDGLYVQTSIDGGATYVTLGAQGDDFNWYNGFINAASGPAWQGTSNGWETASHVLTGLAGESDVRIRFVFASDGSVQVGDGAGVDNITVSGPPTLDLAAVAGATLLNSLCGDAAEQVTATIVNVGIDPVDTFEVAYVVNDTDTITETVVGTLNAGDTLTYTFAGTFASDTNEGPYSIEIIVSAEGDQKALNNSFAFAIAPNAVYDKPLFEDFQGTFRPVAEGFLLVGFGVNPAGNHTLPSAALSTNLWNGNQQATFLTPVVGDIEADDSMSFDYRYVDYFAGDQATQLANDSLLIGVSTDCGQTFSLVFVIDANNHTASTDYATVTLDLTPYAGQEVQFIFQGNWGVGSTNDYFLDIDNINFYGCPADLDLSVDTQSATSGAMDGSLTVSVGGGTPPYSYQWAVGDTTATLDNTFAGEHTVTVTDANGCTDVMVMTLGFVCPDSFDITATATNQIEGGALGSVDFTLNAGQGPFTVTTVGGVNVTIDGTTGTVSGLVAGDYTFDITDANGCAQTFNVTVDFTSGLQPIAALNSATLMPNPTHGISSLLLDFKSAQDVEVSVVNLLGQTIVRQQLQQVTHTTVDLDLSDEPAGIYVVRVAADGGVYTTRLVRTR